MVTFEETRYGLRLTFTGGTAAGNVAECIEQGTAQFGRMAPGWRLAIDVREAPIMSQPDFERMAAYIAGFTNPPVRVAMLVASSTFAMQLRRLYRSVGSEDRIRVFESPPGPGGLTEAEAFVA